MKSIEIYRPARRSRGDPDHRLARGADLREPLALNHGLAASRALRTPLRRCLHGEPLHLAGAAAGAAGAEAPGGQEAEGQGRAGALGAQPLGPTQRRGEGLAAGLQGEGAAHAAGSTVDRSRRGCWGAREGMAFV